jgi:hypothetical protein
MAPCNPAPRSWHAVPTSYQRTCTGSSADATRHQSVRQPLESTAQRPLTLGMNADTQTCACAAGPAACQRGPGPRAHAWCDEVGNRATQTQAGLVWSHLCAVANGDVTEHRGARTNEHIRADLGVSITDVLARPAKRHVLHSGPQVLSGSASSRPTTRQSCRLCVVAPIRRHSCRCAAVAGVLHVTAGESSQSARL